MRSVKILFKVMVGMVSGVVVGMLFAPEKGLDTRKKLFQR
jgi:gas vesicle protein